MVKGGNALLLGDYIKQSRKELKISQRELAKKIDTSNTFISNLEKNVIKNPNPALLNKIIYELNLDYFYVMKLAGYITERLVSRESEEFITQHKKNWLNNIKDVKKLEVDYQLYSSCFDIFLIRNDGHNEFLKIITNLVDKEILEQEIKLLALDLIISEYYRSTTTLNIIYPKKQIPKDEYEDFLSIVVSLSYIPITINLFIE